MTCANENALKTLERKVEQLSDGRWTLRGRAHTIEKRLYLTHRSSLRVTLCPMLTAKWLGELAVLYIQPLRRGWQIAGSADY